MVNVLLFSIDFRLLLFPLILAQMHFPPNFFNKRSPNSNLFPFLPFHNLNYDALYSLRPTKIATFCNWGIRISHLFCYISFYENAIKIFINSHPLPTFDTIYNIQNFLSCTPIIPTKSLAIYVFYYNYSK